MNKFSPGQLQTQERLKREEEKREADLLRALSKRSNSFGFILPSVQALKEEVKKNG